MYGCFIADGYLAHSVFQYFNNGGRQCYVVRVDRSDAAVARVTVQNRAATAGGRSDVLGQEQGRLG